MRRVGVVGAGVMGSGIAQVLAVAGYEVVCRDVDGKALDAARDNVDSGRYGVRSAMPGFIAKELCIFV